MTTAIRRVVREPLLLAFMALKMPGWKGLDYIRKGTDTYAEIKKWYGREAERLFDRFQVENTIVYDPADDCFVGADYDYWDQYFLDFAFSSVFPAGFASYVQVADEITFVREELFPPEFLSELEKMDVIEERVELPDALICRDR